MAASARLDADRCCQAHDARCFAHERLIGGEGGGLFISFRTESRAEMPRGADHEHHGKFGDRRGITGKSGRRILHPDSQLTCGIHVDRLESSAHSLYELQLR